MNRKERRAAKSRNKSGKLDRVAAVHEAGHAVALILTADKLGSPPEQAISYIDVGSGKNMGTSAVDRSITFRSQAATYAPTLSIELQRTFDRTVAGIPREQWGRQHFLAAFAAARAEGVDVDGWLKARMLFSVFGSVAEAKYTGKTSVEVWQSLESEDDYAAAVREGVWAGMDTPQIASHMANAIADAEALLAKPNVQRAVYALADALPRAGRMSGKKAYKIIAAALAEQTAPVGGEDLEKLRISGGGGPKFSRIGRAIRYAKSDLDEFTASKTTEVGK